MDTGDRERGHRPLAFDKMEGLVREMQDQETGVPVRSQKLFLTSIPSAFTGYDLIEWLMEHLSIEESLEALHLANQLCQYGYFFPVNDSKNLVIKDDSSFYRFQTPYYWPWQHKHPDNVDYAIYLTKRTLRNRQRHGLEEYELETLNSLKKNLQNKWEFITMQAEEQVRLAKERKKGDKIVSDSQERAFWRVYRPPPGYINCLEPSPVPNRSRSRAKRKSVEDLKREVDFLRSCLIRTRVKVSQALDNLKQYSGNFCDYDPMLVGALPTNPWITDDPTFWVLNSSLVEVPTEKRVRRWSMSIEELVSDPTGLQEFTSFLQKEYSHENIRFWLAVNDLRRSAQSHIHRKVKEIFDEFLAPGAPCEINIDSKTMERVHQELRMPSRFTFDAAAEHVYMLLLKKDCYPRFIRSEHYKNLLATGIQPLQKKRFFNFGGPARKKISSTTPPNQTALLQQITTGAAPLPPSVGIGRRGSDRSLSGSVHELVACGVKDVVAPRVVHSHSQSNLTDISFRETVLPTTLTTNEILADKTANVCPWNVTFDTPSNEEEEQDTPQKKSSVSSMQAIQPLQKNSSMLDSGDSSSDISIAMAETSDQFQRSCNINARATRGMSEERVTAKIQTIRKYSTASIGLVAERRRPSTYTTRASTSSADEPLSPKGSNDDTCYETAAKKPHSKRASVCVPVFTSNVTAQDNSKGMKGSIKLKDNSVDTASALPETSGEIAEESNPPEAKPSDICPWEDEESCKVDTPFVKTYATLGYL